MLLQMIGVAIICVLCLGFIGDLVTSGPEEIISDNIYYVIVEEDSSYIVTNRCFPETVVIDGSELNINDGFMIVDLDGISYDSHQSIFRVGKTCFTRDVSAVINPTSLASVIIDGESIGFIDGDIVIPYYRR